MCGIIGYSGHRPAVTVIIEGLSRLEYRGYDSAGVAFVQNKELNVIRAAGKLSALQDKLTGCNVSSATTGIGHTRWATHGLPVERNAHPHADGQNRLAMVHNGIIENYQDLRNELTASGYTFRSETDTEVLVQLISKEYAACGDLLQAFSSSLARVEGTYALALVDLAQPHVVYGARQSSPLLMGKGIGENFLASDIPAFLPYTRDVLFLEDNEIVLLDTKTIQIFKADSLDPVERETQHITWDVKSAEKGGYKHFMLKEIFEQPRVITDCCTGRIDAEGGEVLLSELDDMPLPKRLHIIACGTSYHAGLWGMQLLESWARIPVSVEIASEFRYRDTPLDPEDAVLVISQSGETADTLAGMRKVQAAGLSVIGLCNVLGSSIAREADRVIYTQAGPEISVASTKAMCSQLTLLYLLAVYWGRKKDTLDEDTAHTALEGLQNLPGVLEAELPSMRQTAREISRTYASASSFLYLGRGLCYPLALEGALKLKEISYIHAEGYAAGEMKHGPIALIDPQFPSFALALNDELFPKVKSNLVEVNAREGKIIALTHASTDLEADTTWQIPAVWGPLNSLLALPVLQLFAYEMADYLGKDVDQPRNLAKSVTVE